MDMSDQPVTHSLARHAEVRFSFFFLFPRADKNHGQQIETTDMTKLAYTRHEPIGVWCA
jgi:hypothetical protein